MILHINNLKQTSVSNLYFAFCHKFWPTFSEPSIIKMLIITHLNKPCSFPYFQLDWTSTRNIVYLQELTWYDQLQLRKNTILYSHTHSNYIQRKTFYVIHTLYNDDTKTLNLLCKFGLLESAVINNKENMICEYILD